jgi:galactonate dehydratase
MKITRIRTVVVNAVMRNWVFVKVETDQAGLYGWGEASLNWKTRAVAATLQDLEPLLIGRDPLDVEQCVRALAKQSYYRLGIIGTTAISGIEHALWDIFGKSVGLPTWRLLGGRARDRVRLYTHLGLGEMQAVYETFDPGPLRERALAVVERGYDAFKVVFIPCSHYTASRGAIRHVGRMMETLRDAVGDQIDIMIDFHGRPASISLALQFIEALSPHGPLFCEEPIQPGDATAMRAVTERAGCPIATGEWLVGLAEFEELFRLQAVNIVQPDLNHGGGLLEGKRIAAAAAYMGVAPHNPNGPIAGAAALHFAVSTPKFVIQEEMSGAVPWYDDVVRTPMRRVGSHWEVPEEPGLGVEVDEAEAAKHPFEQEVIHSQNAVLDDGTIVDW